jgi:hypothetical protein
MLMLLPSVSLAARALSGTVAQNKRRAKRNDETLFARRERLDERGRWMR